MAEVAVERDEREIMVDARLRDENVREFRFMTCLNEPGPKESGALPELGPKLEHGKAGDILDQCRGQSGIAQCFTDHNRRQQGSTFDDRLADGIDVAARLAAQKSPQ